MVASPDVVSQTTSGAFGTILSGFTTGESVQYYINGALAATFAADANGKVLLDTTLLHIGLRKDATLELKTGDSPQVWPYYTVSDLGPAISWRGEAPAVYFGRSAEDCEAVLKALSQTTDKPASK